MGAETLQLYMFPMPFTLDQYLEICLFDKKGYYKNMQPIGKSGDFITAPEVSQLFGEILKNDNS